MKQEELPTVLIRFLDPETGKDRLLRRVTKLTDLGLSISPDERWVLYSQDDQEGADIMLAEGVR